MRREERLLNEKEEVWDERGVMAKDGGVIGREGTEGKRMEKPSSLAPG